MALRTQNLYFHSGMCKIFSSWNTGSASNSSKFSCFSKSLQRAPNVNNSSGIVGSVVAAKKYQTQAYKSVVKYIKKEREALYSTSTSALEEGKTLSVTGPLTKLQARDLIMRLSKEERTALLTALQEFQAETRKAEYEAGQLAGMGWRSAFGRPSKLPTLGDVDPTGSYCPVPEDWLARKHVCVHNAVPFVGFGFLDNFIMIIAGEQIEMMLGSVMVLSTMAAAALGNTISDVMGIGSAWYVERLATRVGMQPPKLSPIQLDMPSSRRAANMGRALGVTLGCFLGMTPLLFVGKKKDESDEEEPT
ncbi:hypothetical protein Cfor_05760 [Coptotermes formosanus]|uniref:Transmembrane protein 65 n=1 Tax=Coptotermes formosanus TaxID=36987 RepID=A0A6L2PWX2_COPFO|nr:hypothetical protein Cfor_05760 [Coptotermes formosanus]